MRCKSFTAILLTFFILIISCKESSAISINIGGLRLKKPVKSMKEIKLTNVVKQSLDYSCGPAGLAIMFNYYLGHPITEKEIIQTLLKTTSLEKVRRRNGFSLLDLKRFVQFKGYKVVGYKMDAEFLKELDTPVLVPITFKKYRHFVVVKDVIGDRVFFADPTAGNMIMKVDRFVSIWREGIGLVVEDETRKIDSYPLQVKKNEANVVGCEAIKRLYEGLAIRTAIFPAEW